MVLIVGLPSETETLAETLKLNGVDPLCIDDGAKAAALIDAAEQEGQPLDVLFLSSKLHQSQLEWLLAYIRSKETFAMSRVVVLSSDGESKLKYWLQLGANSCVPTKPEALKIAAEYWGRYG
jgi:hypothetical protein